MSSRSFSALGLLLMSLAVSLQLASPANAATGTWVPTAGGTYYWLDANYGDANTPRVIPWGVTGLGTDASPFVPNPIPNGAGDVANLNIDITGNQTVLLDTLITLGVLNLGDADGSNSITIASGTGGTLVFDNGGSSAQLNKAASSTSTDIISTNISLVDSLALAVAGGRIDLTGNITGAGKSITKSGAGAVLLSGASTYDGGTAINEGTVLLGSSTVGGLAGSTIVSGPLGTGTVTIGNTGPVTIQSDSAAARTLSNAIVANGDFTLGATGTGSIMLGGTVNLGGGAPRVITTVGNNYLTGIVSNGGLSLQGTGTLHLRGTNTFSGASTLGAGTTTVIGNAAALGTAAITMGGNTLAADTARTITNGFTLNGDLTLGADPRTSGNYDGQLTLSGTIALGGATRTITVNTSGVPTTISTIADTLSGNITGGGIVKEGNGRLILGGTNTITGFQINAGVLQFNTGPSMGQYAGTVAAGTNYYTLNGGVLAFNNGSQTNAPTNAGMNITANSTVDVMAAGNLVMFNNSAATMIGTGDLTKVGTGGFILVGSGTSTWSGNLNVVQGVFMAGTTGTASNGALLAAVNSIAVQSAATFRVANGTSAAGNNGNRVNNAAGITMNGGLVEFDISNPTAGVNYSETLGVITANRGANGIVADQAAAAATSALTLSDLVRNTGATVNFASGTAFTAGSAGLGQTTQNTIILSLLNGAATPTGFIGGWATVNTAAASSYATSTTAAEWAKYDSVLGVQTFVAADYNGGGAFAEGSMTAATYHAKIVPGAANTTVTLGGARTAGSLHISAGAATNNLILNQNGNAFTVDSGGILVSGTATTTAHSITGGTLTVGAGNELIVNTVGTNSLNIGSTLAGTMALTKSGTGVLTLSGTNSFTGGVFLNQGTIRIAPGLNGTSLSLPSSNNISVVTGTLASTSAAALVIQNNITIYDSLTLGDSTGAARHMLTGNITLSAATGGIASIIAHTNTTTQILGNISGGSLRIAQVGGTGRVALQGTNTFAATDRIQVDSGFLTVGSAGALGSAKIVLNGGGIETGFGYRGAISNDILLTNNSTIGGAVHGHPLLLTGTVDLGGTTRQITNDGAGVFTEFAGVITNGGFTKAGNGVAIFSNANNNYMGGTSIADGFIHLKGNGVAGANVFGNDITVNTGVSGDGGIKLDGPSNLGSNQVLTFNLPAAMTTGTQALSLGTGFSGNSNANRMVGFQPVTGGTGTGIMNIRINNVANGKLLLSLDGLTLNQDVIGGVGGTNAAASNVRVWIGASAAGGVLASPISAGFGGHYRLGGGLDANAAANNLAGVLQVNANVIADSGLTPNILYIGAEDNVALSNIGNNSIVWMRGVQSNFSGTVSIGAGGILNVAEGAYLGTGSNITFRGGTLRILNESGLAGFDTGHINNSFSGKNITVGVGGGTLRHDSGTGNFSNQWVQFGSLTLDASDATAANRTFTIQDGGVNNGGVIFSSLTLTNNATNLGVINVGASYARITGGVTVGAGGLQKAGGGSLILDTPSATTIPLLDMNGGTLILANVANFAATTTNVSGSSGIMARSNAGTYTLNLGAVNLSNNLALTFGNTDGSGPTSSTVNFGSNITTVGGARTLTVRAWDDTTVNGTGAVALTGGNLTYAIEAGYYVQSGLVSGTNAVVKGAGRGLLELSNGSNSFSGGLNAGQGTTLISAAGAQGTGTISFTGGTGMLLATNGVSMTNALQLTTGSAGTNYLGGLTGSQTFSGNFNIAAVTGLSTVVSVVNFDAAGTTTFSGVISQGNTGGNSITKMGNGTVVFNAANTYGSAATVTNTVHRGIWEGVAQASGSPFGAAANNFVLSGGAFKLTGIASATATTHTGSLVVGGNNYGGRLIIDATAGGSTAFTVGSLGTRVGRGTLTIVPQTGSFGTNENLKITTAPTGANFANGIIAPYVVKQASAVSGVGNFVTMSGADVVDMTYTAGTTQGDLNAIVTTGTTVFNNNTATTLTAAKSVYSLRTDSSIDLGGFNLNIGDQTGTGTVSGLILNNNANITGSGNSELHMGASEMNVFVGTGFTSTISARIASLDATTPNSLPFSTNSNTQLTTNTGLTKSGNGTLILTAANRYSGITTVVGGTLQAGAANVIGQFSLNQRVQSSDLQIAAGATFDMSGAGFDQNIGSLAGQGIINLGSNTLTVGNGSIVGTGNAVATTVFSGQILASSGATLLKTGVGVLELSNVQTGSLANSAISNIFVDQGTLRVQVTDGAAYGGVPNGDTFALNSQSAIVNGSTFQLRGGTLDLRYNFGDVAGNAHTLRTGYNINSLLSSTINADTGFTTTTSNKQITVNDVTVNRFTLSTGSGNTNILQIDGTLTMTENANLNIAGDLIIGTSADITDDGNYYTLNKQGAANLAINSDTTFVGGTVVSLGRILFGQRGQWSSSYEEMPSAATITYNSTAKLGTGDIWLNSFSNVNGTNAIRLAETNLRSDQLLYVRSGGLGAHQSIVEVMHDTALSDYHLRSTTQGALSLLVGPTTSSTNVGRWATTLDFQKLGNGRWGISAVTDAVYDNSVLGVGVGETYRFYGATNTSGALIFNKENTLTGGNRVEVGQSSLQFGPTTSMNSNAIVLFAADQNYTGKTMIYRGATQNANLRAAPQNILRVYGDLSTSGIENYGRLELIGAGRLTNDAGTNVVPLTMRIGSYLLFDYYSAFNSQTNATGIYNTPGNYLTDTSAVDGINATNVTNKFQDDVTLVLPGSTLELRNFTTRDTQEVIGGLSIAGLSDVVLGTNANAAMVLELRSAITFNSVSDTLRISGAALGTAQPTGASGTAHTRFVFTNPAHAPTPVGILTNGVSMLSPRFFYATSNTFLGYTPGLGFIPVSPNLTSTAAAWTTPTLSTDYVDLTTNAVTSVAAVQNLFALRTSVGIASTAAYTINIGSGGLIFNSAAGATFTGLQSTTQASAVAGTFAFTGDAYIWNATAFTHTIRNNITTGGVLSINGVGGSTLVLAGNNTINGDIVLNGGALNIFNANNDGATTASYWNSGAVNPTGGSGTNIVLLGSNNNNTASALPRLELRNAATGTITTRNLVIGTADHAVPYVEINTDRPFGSATNQIVTIGGGLTVNGAGSEGTAIQFTNGNDYDLTISGAVALNTVSTNFNVINTSGTHIVTLSGAVSGISSLVKTGSGFLSLGTAGNTYTGGTYLNAGTLQISGAVGTGTYLGTGPLIVNGGLFQLNGTTNTAQQNYVSGAGNSVVVNGNFQHNTQGVTQLIQMGNVGAVWQTSNSPVIRFDATNNNNASFQWIGSVRLSDNSIYFVNNDQGNTIRGGVIWGSNNASAGLSGSGMLQKAGYGNLTFNFGAGGNTYSGDINVFQGGIRAEQANDKYTTGKIAIMPGAWITARANGTATYDPNQVTMFMSNSTALSGIVLRNTTDAYSAHLNASSIFTGNADGSAVGAAGSGTNGGMLSLEGTYGGPIIDMATVFGGYWYLGASVQGGTYNLATLGAGAAETALYGLSNTGVYRLAGNDGTLTLSTANLLTGVNSAVQIGKAWATNGRGAVTISASNNYGGGTVIGIGRDRGTGNAALAALAVTTGGGTGASLTATPLGTGAVDVYGRIQFGGATGAANSSVTANDNLYTFHSGSRLRFEFNESNTITQAQGGKWGDTVAIALNGTSLEVNGENTLNSTDNHEIVGDISFGRASEIRIVGNGTNGTAALTTPTLTRNAATYGVLRFTHSGSVLGSLGSTTNDAENFLITNFAASSTAGNGNWASPTGTGHYSLTNDAVMLNPYLVSGSDIQWMRYNGTNGMQTLFSNGTSYTGNVYQRFATAGSIGTGITTTQTNITGVTGAVASYGTNVAFANNGTEILDISNALATLSTNLDILALRMGGSTNLLLAHDATNAFNTVQIRSGGMILNTTNNENTIRANLVFGTAATPGTAYVYSQQNITNFDGQITASDFVKFGAGTVRIMQDQRSFAGKWVVNQGTLEFDTVRAVGFSGTNQILLNGGSASNTDTLSIPTVNFVTQNNSQAQSGDLSLSTFSHGLLTVVDAGQIRFFSPSDRQIQIGDVSLTTTSSVKGLQPGYLIVQTENSRTIGNFGNVTIDDDWVFKIEAASFSNGSVLGMGTTVGSRFNNLNNQGLYDITKIGDGMMYLGDISSSFTGSRTFTVNEGSVRVEHATGSLGAAGTKFIVDNGGAIDIAVSGFNPLGTLVQNVGSIERWSVNGARNGGSFTLGTGVHLQINQSQTGTQTINLNGGSLMGYLAADLDAIAVIRTLDSGITLNLLADSYLGQIYPFSGTLAYDMGKQNGYIADPFNPRLNGALLDIKGNITGNSNLIKVGTDVIQISSTGNTYGNTIIKGGVLMMGVNNALPTTKTLTTQGNGVLDLNGFSTTVGSIAGTTGTITSGATTATNFNVGGDNSDFGYTGVVAQGVRIVKQGTGEFTLGGTGQTATITAGSKTVTVTNTAGWYVGMPVAGPGIPSGTTIAAITSTTTILLSTEAVAAGTRIAPANIHWGGMELVAGKVKVSDDASLGLAPNSEATGADNITFSGGALHIAETFATAATRGLLVNAPGGTIEVDGGKTLTVGGKMVLNGRMTTVGNGNSVFNGVISGPNRFVKSGTGTATFNAINTQTGKVEVAQGTLTLGATGSISDASWIEVKSGATFNTNAVVGGAKVDGVVSGQGNITGHLVITSNVGTNSNDGVLMPGSSIVDLVPNAGELNGTLNFENLTLAGSSSPVTRALFTVSTATLNDAANIKTNIDNGTLLSYLNSQENAWNAAAIGDHDSINISGTLSLGKGGQIVLQGWTPVYGDVLDLMDWASVLMNDFDTGASFSGNSRAGGLLGDLNLPTLGSGLSYDLTLFNTSGMIVVVPEPGRAMLLFLGLLALGFRRRRRSVV